MPKFACIRPLSMLLLYSTVFCFKSIKYTRMTGTTSTSRSNMPHTDTAHMYAYLSAFMLKIHCIPSTYRFPPTHSPNLETTTRTLTTSKPYRTVLYFSRLVLDLGSFSTNATVETHCHTVFPTDVDQYTRRRVVYLKNTNTPLCTMYSGNIALQRALTARSAYWSTNISYHCLLGLVLLTNPQTYTEYTIYYGTNSPTLYHVRRNPLFTTHTTYYLAAATRYKLYYWCTPNSTRHENNLRHWLSTTQSIIVHSNHSTSVSTVNTIF